MKFTYKISTKKNKKLMVEVNGKIIHFGQLPYQHFKDLTGLLPKSLNHGDKKRQKSYLARTKNKFAKDINSPNFHSRKVLWGG